MSFPKERDFSDVCSIPQFYEGKTVFITGGSGFMGKVLIEKLLFSCSGLDRIYLLMRTKKGVKPEDRLDEIYSSQCFDRLKEHKPKLFESKVFIINGDITEPGIGLSVEDRALLVNRVHIVFHVAASVRFDDPLHIAAKQNLRGTVEVMELVRDMKSLTVMVHVSTSYCNATRALVDEVIYPPLVDWREALQVCETIDDHTLQVLTPKYLGDVPNTYTFTKQLAEHVVYEAKGQVPIVIFRPSIVISSLDEPMPGWIDNYNGPVGLVVAIGKDQAVSRNDRHVTFIGVLRCMRTNPELKLDYVPVDVCIKNIITAAWLKGTETFDSAQHIPIYHSCFDEEKRFTIGSLTAIGLELGSTITVDDAIWAININTTTSELGYYVQILLFHLLPAVFIDALLRLLGKKPMLVKIQRRIYSASLALRYFMTKQLTFVNKNLAKMRSCIKDVDKEQFGFPLEFPDKVEYIKNCMIGGRIYLLKERDEDIPKALAHQNRLRVVDRIVKFIFYGYLIRFFYLNIYVKYMSNVIDLLLE